MAKIFRVYYAFLFLVFCVSLNVAAQTDNHRKLTKADRQMLKDTLDLRRKKMILEKQAEKEFWKNERRKSKIKPVTDSDVVYIFGVGTNFNDSVVYLTDVTPVAGIRLEPKTKFLPARSDFSLQFREYLEGKLGLVYETTCVFFSDKRKKAQKYAFKLRKRYLDQGYKDIIVVDPQKFSFELPNYLKSQNKNQ